MKRIHRKRAARCLILCMVLAASLTPRVQAQVESSPASDQSYREALASLASRVPDIEPRLAALDAADPEQFLLLAEEVAGEARTDIEYRLAQHLYVLCILHSQSPGGRNTLGASACIGLADVTRSEADRRMLSALASLLDDRFAMRDWSRVAEVAIADDVAFAATTALGNIRAGQGHLARDVIKRPDVQALYRRFSRVLTGEAGQDPLSDLEREANRWPCPECRNERISTKRPGGRVEVSLCFTCRGNPGPQDMSREHLIAQLRFESLVLSATQRSWGAQLATDLGLPMRDVDVSSLAERFSVDPARWRCIDGRWIAPAASEPATPQEPVAPDETPDESPDQP